MYSYYVQKTKKMKGFIEIIAVCFRGHFSLGHSVVVMMVLYSVGSIVMMPMLLYALPAQDEVYVLLYANSSWYLFIRLYHMFCQRLRDIHHIADARQREACTSLESSCEQLIYYTGFVL